MSLSGLRQGDGRSDKFRPSVLENASVRVAVHVACCTNFFMSVVAISISSLGPVHHAVGGYSSAFTGCAIACRFDRNGSVRLRNQGISHAMSQCFQSVT